MVSKLNEKQKDAFWDWFLTVLLAVFVIIGLFFTYRLWERNLSVPLSSAGDTLGALATAQNLWQNNGLYEFTSLGAPYIMDNSSNVQDYVVPAFIMWIVSRLCNSGAMTLNMYYFLTYILTAEITFYTFRRIGIKRGLAFTIAIIYSFAPYHIFRSFAHIWVTSYYFLPLGLLGVYYIITGELFRQSDKSGNKFLKIIKSNWFISILGAILVGLSSIYYAVFLSFCYFFAIIYNVCCQNKWKEIKKGITAFILIVVMILPTFVMQIMVKKQAMEVAGVDIFSERTVSELRAYSLRLMPLILPIPCHRIGVLNSITKNYYEQVPLLDEVYMEALGGITCIAFIISIFVAFMPIVKKKEIKGLCLLNLFLIVLGLTDGANIFVGLFVSPNIRCYNRLSIFIALISLMSLCLMINNVNIKHKTIEMIIFACVIILSIYDQTPYTLSTSMDLDLNDFSPLESYKENEEQYLAQKSVIDEMEEQLPDEAMVLTLPIGDATNASSLYKTRAYICSEDLRFNYQWAGENSFNKRISKLDILEQADVASMCGFKAILIDKEYYSEEEYEYIKEQLESMVGKEHSHNGTTWVWYNLSDYYDSICSVYSKEEIDEISRRYTENFNGFYEFYRAYEDGLMYTDEVSMSGNFVEVRDGIVQYGPYITLPEGEYHITYNGDNLNLAEFWCTAEGGNVNIEIHNLVKNSEETEYDIILSESTNNIEFLMRGGECKLKYIEIEGCK